MPRGHGGRGTDLFFIIRMLTECFHSIGNI